MSEREERTSLQSLWGQLSALEVGVVLICPSLYACLCLRVTGGPGFGGFGGPGGHGGPGFGGFGGPGGKKGQMAYVQPAQVVYVQPAPQQVVVQPIVQQKQAPIMVQPIVQQKKAPQMIVQAPVQQKQINYAAPIVTYAQPIVQQVCDTEERRG